MNQSVNDNSKEKIEFENSLLLRNFEIDLFWKRSWFFGALILAEIAGFYTMKTGGYNFVPSVIIAFIICLTILAQCLMNRGSKYWQERWEYMTMNRESSLGIELTRLKQFKKDNLDKWFAKNFTGIEAKEWFFIDASILSKKDNFFTTSRRFSVSKITFLVWDVIFLCALLCWLNESYKIISSKIQWEFTIKLSVFYIIVFGYIYIFWRKGKVVETYTNEMVKMKKEDLEKICEIYTANRMDDDFFNLEK